MPEDSTTEIQKSNAESLRNELEGVERELASVRGSLDHESRIETVAGQAGSRFSQRMHLLKLAVGVVALVSAVFVNWVVSVALLSILIPIQLRERDGSPKGARKVPRGDYEAYIELLERKRADLLRRREANQGSAEPSN